MGCRGCSDWGGQRRNDELPWAQAGLFFFFSVQYMVHIHDVAMSVCTQQGCLSSLQGASDEEAKRCLRSCVQARVNLLMAHGVLHLLGHDHEDPPSDDESGGSSGHDEEAARGKGTDPKPLSPRAEKQWRLMVKEEERLVAGLRDAGLLPTPAPLPA